MQAVLEFFGRFHPLLVHLPIGILMVATLFELLSTRGTRFSGLRPALPMLYLLGSLGAVGACLTGYVLSLSGDYGGDLLLQHQWSGILTATLGLFIFFLHQRQQPKLWLSLLLLVLLSVAGHFGGSLTHGSDYLLAPLQTDDESAKITITDPEQALVYEDLIVPIFTESCYPCHNEQKQKGKLRLDSPEWIKKGGKSGQPMIQAGTPAGGELLARIQLPESDDEHMPPSKKYALSASYESILVWWLEQGGDFTAQVKDLPESEPILTLLEAMRTEEPEVATYPEVTLPSPDAQAVKKLKSLRVGVLPIATQSNLLEVSLINVDSITPSLLEALQALAPHIAWLRCSDQPLTSAQVKQFTDFTHLTKLYLDDTQIDDESLLTLSQLPSLRYLNLKGTAVTASGLGVLAGANLLEQIFVYQTGISADEIAELAETMPQVQIDGGGYQVPTLATDTTLVE